MVLQSAVHAALSMIVRIHYQLLNTVTAKNTATWPSFVLLYHAMQKLRQDSALALLLNIASWRFITINKARLCSNSSTAFNASKSHKLMTPLQLHLLNLNLDSSTRKGTSLKRKLTQRIFSPCRRKRQTTPAASLF